MAVVERMQTILADVGEQLQPVIGDIARRVRAILIWPRAAWPVIAAERSDLGRLFLHYVVPLSAIPPLAKLIGWSLFSSYVGIGAGLASACLSYVLGLGAIAVLALAASMLAARFEGRESLGQAAKLIAYSATAAWLGGIFRLVPVISILSLPAALYSWYLLYTGAPAVMGVPEDRAGAYAGVLAAITVLVFAITSLIQAVVIGIDTLGMI